MQRMTGLDAAFLSMETKAHPMHTLKLLVLSRVGDVQPGAQRPLRAWLEEALRERLHLLPALRWRVLEVPYGVHRPLWIEDPRFELGAHLHARVVPSPGGAAEVDRVVAEIAARPLDRARPLWEMWALEGLEGGASAVLVKIHHALGDGTTIAHLLRRVMSETPAGAIGRGRALAASPSELPPPRALLGMAARDLAREVWGLGALLRTTSGRVSDLLRHRRAGSVRSPLPVRDTPRTSFNRALGPSRSFASTTLPLATVRAIKRARGVTLNDVVLAVVAGALRDYLAARGELPARPLIASVPTAAPHPLFALGGNHVSSLFVSLETDRADPLARLAAIHASAAAAKATQDVIGPDLMEAWAAFLLPGVLGPAISGWSALRLANYVPAPLNVIVSNVRGPMKELYLPGHRLEAIYSVGPVLEGIGLNVTVWSYRDRLHVAVLAAGAEVPEPRLITERMHAALEALRLASTAG